MIRFIRGISNWGGFWKKSKLCKANLVYEAFGAWESKESADEIINEIRNSPAL
jgi:hypothetical protein